MAKASIDTQIKRALSAMNGRRMRDVVSKDVCAHRVIKRTLKFWTALSVDEALNFQRSAIDDGHEDLAAIYFAMDTIAYAIRHTEFTGRHNFAIFDAPYSEALPYLIRMISATYRGKFSCDMAADAYKTFAALYDEHKVAA